MNNSVTKSKMISDGALIVSMYMVFLFISRMTNSFLEYNFFLILPIPISIYAYKYDFKTSIIPSSSTFILSFIMINYLNALTIILPAMIIGSLFGGILVKRTNKFWTNILIVTFLCALKEIFVSLLWSSLMGVTDIFQDLALILDKISDFVSSKSLNVINMSLISSLVYGAIPFFILGTSLIEAFCIWILFSLLAKRLNLTKEIDIRIIDNIFMTPKFFSIIYFLLIISLPFVINSFLVENVFIHTLDIICINTYLIMILFMTYQCILLIMVFARLKKQPIIGFLLSILAIVFMPISGIIGAIDVLIRLKLKLLSSKKE